MPKGVPQHFGSRSHVQTGRLGKRPSFDILHRWGALQGPSHGLSKVEVRELFPVVTLTDCKSVFDNVHRVGEPNAPSEKRLVVDLAALRRMVKQTTGALSYYKGKHWLGPYRIADGRHPGQRRSGRIPQLVVEHWDHQAGLLTSRPNIEFSAVSLVQFGHLGSLHFSFDPTPLQAHELAVGENR